MRSKRASFCSLLVFLLLFHLLHGHHAHVHALQTDFNQEQNRGDMDPKTPRTSTTTVKIPMEGAHGSTGVNGGSHGSSGHGNGNGEGSRQNQGPNLIPLYAAGQNMHRQNNNNRRGHRTNEAPRSTTYAYPNCFVLPLLQILFLLV